MSVSWTKGKILLLIVLKIYPLNQNGILRLYSLILGGMSDNPGICRAMGYGRTTHCPFLTMESNSLRRKSTCYNANWWWTILRTSSHWQFIQSHSARSNPPPPPTPTPPGVCIYESPHYAGEGVHLTTQNHCVLSALPETSPTLAYPPTSHISGSTYQVSLGLRYGGGGTPFVGPWGYSFNKVSSMAFQLALVAAYQGVAWVSGWGSHWGHIG